MKLVQAKQEDLQRINEFYHYVLDHNLNATSLCHWQKDIYPCIQDFMKYILQEEMFLFEENGVILAAAAISNKQNDDYHAVEWKIQVQDDEVNVIHILCTNPDYAGKGNAKKAVKIIQERAKKLHKKAIRLDALSTNIPALHLYESFGFINCGTLTLYFESTGWAKFYLYELIL